MRSVSTPNAPPPAGHYSQAIVHGGMVYLAGQLPKKPGVTEQIPGTVEEQTEQVLRNLEGVLEAAGSSLSRLVQITIFVSDITLWSRVNEVFARVMGSHRPARAVVPVGELPSGFVLEIQAIAALDRGADEG